MSDTDTEKDIAPEAVPQEILEYETDYEIGQDNVEVMGLDIHNPVFFLAAGFVLFFSVLTLVFPTASGELLATAKQGTSSILTGFLQSHR